MNLKTYRASTIADALAQVKREMGADAVILHTRTYKRGGWFGFGGRPVVEITASTSVNIAPGRRAREEHRPSGAQGGVIGAGASREAVRRAYGAPVGAGVGSGVGPTAAVAADEWRPAHSPGETRIGALTTAAPLAPVDANTRAVLEQELMAIKSMVARVVSSSARSRCGAMPEALQKNYLRLLEAEVASEIADDVVDGVRAELTLDQLGDDETVRRAVLERIAAFIPVADDAPAPERAPDGRPHTVALVGPTGVGKTTTVAKLAATYKLRHGKSVGLITADTYRIAAVEQLRTYANIIGLPLRVVSTPAEMRIACDALKDCDVVLIDTAGRSQHDDARLDELRAFVDAANPHQTHLVLSSTSSESALLHTAERFVCVKPTRVIFTKLDEAVNFGTLVNVGRRINAALSYVTTGQEVPDRIEQGRADRIARLVLEGAPDGRSW